MPNFQVIYDLSNSVTTKATIWNYAIHAGCPCLLAIFVADGCLMAPPGGHTQRVQFFFVLLMEQGKGSEFCLTPGLSCTPLIYKLGLKLVLTLSLYPNS